MEWYKKHRPKTLDDVIGNKSSVSSLKKALKNGLPQAMLFHGPSGCGKTTIARILKTHLRCSDFDFIEMNSASFRGIDSVRDILKASSLCCSSACKIFLLDEAHQMTKDAQNALLKILEDTPPKTYFMICTTDPSKLIKAVRTRCTEFAVEPMKGPQLAILLEQVSKAEGLELNTDVRDLIIEKCDESARQALVLLEQVAGLRHEDAIDVLSKSMGAASPEVIDLCRALIKDKPNWSTVRDILKNIKEDDESIRRAILGYAKAVLLKSGKRNSAEIIDLFDRPFYDNNAGLVLCCWRICNP